MGTAVAARGVHGRAISEFSTVSLPNDLVSPSISPPRPFSPELHEFIQHYLGHGGRAVAPIGRLAVRRKVAQALADGNESAEPLAVRMDLQRDQRLRGCTFQQLASELDVEYRERTDLRVRLGQLRTREARGDALGDGVIASLRERIDPWDRDDEQGDLLLKLAEALEPLELEAAIGLAAVHHVDGVHASQAIVADIPAMLAEGGFGMTTAQSTRIIFRSMSSEQFRAIDEGTAKAVGVMRSAATAASRSSAGALKEACEWSSLVLLLPEQEKGWPTFFASGGGRGITVLPHDFDPSANESVGDRLAAAATHEAVHRVLERAFGQCHSPSLVEALTTAVTMAVYPHSRLAALSRKGTDEMVRLLAKGRALEFSPSAVVEVANTFRDRRLPVESDSAYAFGHLLIAYLADRHPETAVGLAIDVYRHACAPEIQDPEDPSIRLVVGGVQQEWARERDINRAALHRAFGERPGMAFEQKAFKADFAAFFRQILNESSQAGGVDRAIARRCVNLFGGSAQDALVQFRLQQAAGAG